MTQSGRDAVEGLVVCILVLAIGTMIGTVLWLSAQLVSLVRQQQLNMDRAVLRIERTLKQGCPAEGPTH